MQVRLWRVLHWRLERRMVRELEEHHQAALEAASHEHCEVCK